MELLAAIYNFSPIKINTDFDMGQIQALKKCPHFKKISLFNMLFLSFLPIYNKKY